MSLDSDLATEVFDAFEWRQRPSRTGERVCWSSCLKICFFGYYGMDTSDARCLVDVPPRDLTLDLVQTHFVYPDPLTCFKKDAFLYCLPAFISFWIADPKTDNALFDIITWRFRYCPFSSAVSRWRDEILNQTYSERNERYFDRFLSREQDWFLAGDDWPRTADLVLSMTPTEREAVASFFDFLPKAAPGYDDNTELESVSALLRGKPTAEVLGGRSEEDNALLLGALDALRTRVPAVADDLAAVERAIREGTSIDVLAESVRYRKSAREWA